MTERRNPYDLMFTDELEARLQAIGEEAAERDVDARDRERFTMLLGVGEVLAELVPDGASPDVIREVAGLLYHCYHFHVQGKQTFDIEEPVLRELLSTAFLAGPSRMSPPVHAGYVRLPRNRVWSRITEDAHAEAIDGFFFVGGHVLYVLGLLPGRPGFSIMEVSETPETELTSVADLKARADGDDFANVLPGGELQGHFAITNTAEALKLAARCFWHLARRG